jgi:hypothetical protein
MSITAHLPRFRARAEGFMLDAGTAARPTGDGTPQYDPVEQEEVIPTDDLFDSVCKIQSRDVVPREAEVGGRTQTTIRLELHLPADTDELLVGDVFTITAAHELSLAEAGFRYRVLAPVDGTLKTSRRYEVERA